MRSYASIAASGLLSYWYSSAALPRWSAPSIFLVCLPVDDVRSGAITAITPAFFSACIIRYYGLLLLCGASGLSRLVAALASLLATLFSLMPACPSTQYSVILLIRSFLIISDTTAWQALALQLPTDWSADWASEKIRIFVVRIGRPFSL